MSLLIRELIEEMAELHYKNPWKSIEEEIPDPWICPRICVWKSEWDKIGGYGIKCIFKEGKWKRISINHCDEINFDYWRPIHWDVECDRPPHLKKKNYVNKLSVTDEEKIDREKYFKEMEEMIRKRYREG